MTGRRHRWAALLLATIMALAACGGGGDDGNVASLGDDAAAGADDSERDGGGDAKSREDALVDFARCMREQGIDMPDPKFDDEGRGRIEITGPGGDVEAFEAAQKACEEHLDGMLDGGPGLAPDPEFQDKLIRFARCMREQGIDMPDPQFDGNGMIRIEGGGAAAFDPGDPKFKEAQEACKQFQPDFPGDPEEGR